MNKIQKIKFKLKPLTKCNNVKIHAVMRDRLLSSELTLENNQSYKLERYATSFAEYKLASLNFHEAVFNIYQNGPSTFEPIDKLARILDIKHAHFLTCAVRLLGKHDATWCGF